MILFVIISLAIACGIIGFAIWEDVPALTVIGLCSAGMIFSFASRYIASELVKSDEIKVTCIKYVTPQFDVIKVVCE